MCGGWGANGFHRRTKILIFELNVFYYKATLLLMVKPDKVILAANQFAQFLVPNKTSLGSPEYITLQLAYGFARLKIYFK